MASQSGADNPDVNASIVGARLLQEPYCFDFFQAVRLLERFFPDREPIGKFEQPSSEVVRIGAHASLAFPASQIQAIEYKDNSPARLTVNFMGLTGPEGVLPLPYTSLIIERLRAADSSASDFFDIFNHRIISFFYQAWRKYRLEIAYECGERERFSRQLLSVVGLGTPGLEDRQAVPDDATIYYAGLLGQRPRSAQALRQILEDYFDVPVEIEQFTGGWYSLGADDQCRFTGFEKDSEKLGLGVVAGDAVWDQQSRVRLILGPLDLEQYSSFLPDGSCWEALRSWVRFFSNDEFDFELKLILKRDDVPVCELGAEGDGGPRLGWVSWVKSAPMKDDPGDTVLALLSVAEEKR